MFCIMLSDLYWCTAWALLPTAAAGVILFFRRGLPVSLVAVKTEEGAITGESDNVTKDAVNDPFMISGTSMASGTCNMLVTSVGVRSMQGRIMADTAMETKDTPLQVRAQRSAGGAVSGFSPCHMCGPAVTCWGFPHCGTVLYHVVVPRAHGHVMLWACRRS